MKLSLTQKRILELLSINCRFSNKDIAKCVHLSEDAVDYQINKLIKEKKLGNFNVQFNYFLLGYSLYHIFVRVSDVNIDYTPLTEIKELIPCENLQCSSPNEYRRRRCGVWRCAPPTQLRRCSSRPTIRRCRTRRPARMAAEMPSRELMY